MNRWTVYAPEGEGPLITQRRGDEWEARVLLADAKGREVAKARAFAPTEADAKDGALRNLLEKLG